MRMMLVLCLATVVGLFMLPNAATAQWSDNFDSYAAGSGLHGQGGWMGWDGDPTWNAYVTDLYSRSAPNSADIVGRSDIVQEFSGYNSGTWIFTAWQYIPGNFTGTSYFILLNTYNPGGPYNWSTQVSFNSNGMYVESEPEGGTAALVLDTWVEFRVEIDLVANIQTIYYNGMLLTEKSWTEGVSGGGAVDIGALDLFANNASSIYYDDLSLLEDMPVPVQTTTWGQIKDLFR